MTKPFTTTARLCLLGRPGVLADGERTPLALRPKAIALLARLGLTSGPVSRPDLAAELFPDLEDPRAQLRWHLTYLRRTLPPVLGDRLVTARDSATFDGDCDAATFAADAGAVAADPGRPDAVRVLAAYGGDLCDGLAVSASPVFDNWLYVQQEMLRRRFRTAVIAFAKWSKGAGRSADAIDPLARLVSVDPYLEDGHALLIEAYAAVGEHTRARAAYERYENVLRDELHATPRAALAARYSETPPIDARRPLPQDDLVMLAEVTMHVVDWPGGDPTILAIHGSIGSGYGFSAWADQLSPEFRVVAPDLRGHGFSDKPPTGYDLDRHVSDLTELWDSLRLDRPIVLGFSAGGAIAARLASARACRGLILLDAVIADAVTVQRAAAEVVGRMAETLDLRFPTFEAYERQWREGRALYSDEAEQLSARVLRFQLARLPDGSFRRRPVRVALEDEWASIVKADTLAALRAVDRPVLVVHAAQPWIAGHAYLSKDVISRQVAVARSAQVAVAARSNHPALVNDPEPAIVEAVRAFTRGVR